jgi:acyl dehydratase
MTVVPVTELDRAPNLTVLFGKAALTGLRRSGSGKGEPTLPDSGYARSDVRTDPAHLADYDRVCGFRLTDELPATYPHMLVFGMQVALMTSEAFPFPMIGLVHVANRITQTRPLRADESLVVRVHAENLRPHERGTQFDMVSQASVDGEPVWTEVSTYLRRGPGKPDAGRGESVERPEGGPVARPDAVWRIPADIGRRYADVSGDRNPIHLHPLTARAFGFPRAIAHGMWSVARCLSFYEGRLPGALTVDVRFKLPILLPATVAFVSGADGFELSDLRTGRPHLAGTVSQA